MKHEPLKSRLGGGAKLTYVVLFALCLTILGVGGAFIWSHRNAIIYGQDYSSLDR